MLKVKYGMKRTKKTPYKKYTSHHTCETCGPVRCEITKGRVAKATPVTTQVRKEAA